MEQVTRRDFVKTAAAVFLITYYLCVQGFPLILAAGLFDGSVAVVLTVLILIISVVILTVQERLGREE